MTEDELKAAITTELVGLNLEMEPVEDVVGRLMDAIRDYSSERESEAAYWGGIEASERG